MKGTKSDLTLRGSPTKHMTVLVGLVSFSVFSMSVYHGASLPRAAAGAAIQSAAAIAACLLRRSLTESNFRFVEFFVIMMLCCNQSLYEPKRSFESEMTTRLLYAGFLLVCYSGLLLLLRRRERRACVSSSPLFDADVDVAAPVAAGGPTSQSEHTTCNSQG